MFTERNKKLIFLKIEKCFQGFKRADMMLWKEYGDVFG